MLWAQAFPQEIPNLEGNLIIAFMHRATQWRLCDDLYAAPVLEGHTAYVLQLRIRTNVEKQTNAGSQEAEVTGSCFWVLPIQGLCAQCLKRPIFKMSEFGVGKGLLIKKVPPKPLWLSG